MRHVERDNEGPLAPRGDGHLYARTTDPATSHLSSVQTEASEGTTHVVKVRTQKYLLLVQYGSVEGVPLTDSQAGKAAVAAGLVSPCPWRKASALREGGFIQFYDHVHDPETDREVMRCRITPSGQAALDAIARGAKVYP